MEAPARVCSLRDLRLCEPMANSETAFVLPHTDISASRDACGLSAAKSGLDPEMASSTELMTVSDLGVRTPGCLTISDPQSRRDAVSSCRLLLRSRAEP